jgi:hypothetical protein
MFQNFIFAFHLFLGAKTLSGEVVTPRSSSLHSTFYDQISVVQLGFCENLAQKKTMALPSKPGITDGRMQTMAVNTFWLPGFMAIHICPIRNCRFSCGFASEPAG